jgi:hypothetical protein
MRFKQRSKVDLPQPDGSIKAVTCLRGLEALALGPDGSRRPTHRGVLSGAP